LVTDAQVSRRPASGAGLRLGFCREHDMSKIALWKAKAAELRELARTTDEAERKRILLVLAEDCAEIAAEIERAGRIRPTASPEQNRLARRRGQP
jgi:hypothetical protein